MSSAARQRRTELTDILKKLIDSKGKVQTLSYQKIFAELKENSQTVSLFHKSFVKSLHNFLFSFGPNEQTCHFKQKIFISNKQKKKLQIFFQNLTFRSGSYDFGIHGNLKPSNIMKWCRLQNSSQIFAYFSIFNKFFLFRSAGDPRNVRGFVEASPGQRSGDCNRKEYDSYLLIKFVRDKLFKKIFEFLRMSRPECNIYTIACFKDILYKWLRPVWANFYNFRFYQFYNKVFS